MGTALHPTGHPPVYLHASTLPVSITCLSFLSPWIGPSTSLPLCQQYPSNYPSSHLTFHAFIGLSVSLSCRSPSSH